MLFITGLTWCGSEVTVKVFNIYVVRVRVCVCVRVHVRARVWLSGYTSMLCNYND